MHTGVLRWSCFFAFLSALVLPPQALAQQPTDYDSGDPTAEEQYILELINRARSNPVAEGTRLGININEGLNPARTVVARPPLAMNKTLLGTARAHSNDMFNRNFFAHTNPDGVGPFERIDAAGYVGNSLGENIAFTSSLNGIPLEDFLMRDPNYPGRGHRVNLLDIYSQSSFVFREIGVGLKSGTTGDGDKSLLTQDFGRAAVGPFLLGVVYVDTNQNGFYDVGEGVSGVSVVPDSGAYRATTGVAGAFAFPVATSGVINVTASGGGLPAPLSARIALSGENVKVDFTPTGVIRRDPNVETIAVLKGPVTNLAGATYSVLGGPESGPFAGTILEGSKSTAVILAGDGSVRLRTGGAAPGLVSSVITKLGVPSGDVVRATLKVGAGGVTALDNEMLIGGLTSGPAIIVARKGQDVANLPNVKVKTILHIDGTGPQYFFLATLGGAVTTKTDSALCVALGDGSVRVVMQEGQTFGQHTGISIISALVNFPGTLGEGRWRAKSDAFGVRVTYLDRNQQCFTVPATAASPADWLPWVATLDPVSGGLIKTLGFPGFGPSGVAAVVTLKSGASTIPVASDTMVIRQAAGNITTILAVEGSPAPDAAGVDIPNSKFRTFGTPVCGADGRVAFTATLSGVIGTTGIWYAPDGNTNALRQLARAGQPAPGGGKFAAFTQLAFADEPGGTPWFTGTLAADRTLGITAANNACIWALGSNGEVQRVLRTGQDITVKGVTRTLASFTTFTAGVDSTGAAHAYNANGQLTIRATFKDRTVALLRVTAP